MTGAERGILLLTCPMGDPARKVLTANQLRTLAQRLPRGLEGITPETISHLGYKQEIAERIVSLLSEEARLDHYLRQGEKQGCVPIVRGSEMYPKALTHRLGWEAPGCLWARGDLSLLNRTAISLVGSRDLAEPNLEFAREVGRLAARRGIVLISGNARGADRTAQEACLEAGGRVISIVADELYRQSIRERVLYVSEDSFDARFTSRRALSRNRCIHAMAILAFVAQSSCGKGGTWSGTTQNLKHHWSPVACFRDGSEAMEAYRDLGASLVGIEDLDSFRCFPEEITFF